MKTIIQLLQHLLPLSLLSLISNTCYKHLIRQFLHQLLSKLLQILKIVQSSSLVSVKPLVRHMPAIIINQMLLDGKPLVLHTKTPTNVLLLISLALWLLKKLNNSKTKLEVLLIVHQININQVTTVCNALLLVYNVLQPLSVHLVLVDVLLTLENANVQVLPTFIMLMEHV